MVYDQLLLRLHGVRDVPGDGFRICCRVEINVLEGFWNKSACLGVVLRVKRFEIDVSGISDVVCDSHVEGKDKVGVLTMLEIIEGKRTESTGTVTTHDTVVSAKLPNIIAADARELEASFDAITFVLDLGEGEVNFCGDAGHIETSYVYGQHLTGPGNYSECSHHL